MESGNKIENLKRRLSRFPSSFQLKLKGNERSMRVKKVIQTVKEEQLNDHRTYNGNRNDNLLSYLYFERSNFEKASELNARVRKNDPENIVAVTNFVYLAIHDKNLIDGEKELNRLEAMENDDGFKYKLATAKSEIAFSYSRFGPHFHREALYWFKQVIDEQHEDNWLWQFGYFLVLQRCLSSKWYLENPGDFDANELFVEALQAFSVVVRHDKAHAAVKAKAWTKLQSFLALYNSLPTEFRDVSGAIELVNSFSLSQVLGSIDEVREYCIGEAIRLAPEDRTVLQECGKYEKEKGNFNKAIEYFKKAEEIQGNTVIYLHLGDIQVLKWQNKVEESRKRAGAIENVQTEPQLTFPFKTLSNTRFVEDVFSNFSLISTEVHLNLQSQLPYASTSVSDVGIDELKEALEYYRKAYDVSKSDVAAVYIHKGRVHLQLGQTDEAINYFSSVLHLKSSSLAEAMIACELIGQCYVYKSHTIPEDHPDQKQVLIQKATSYFLQAIENSASIAMNVPFEFVSECHITLYDILHGKVKGDPSDVSSCLEFCYFSRLINKHGRSLELLDDKIASDPCNWEYCFEKFKTLASACRYADALFFVDAQIPPELATNVLKSREIFKETAIKAAAAFLVEKRFTEAKQHFKKAYGYFAAGNLESHGRHSLYDVYISGEQLSDATHLRYFQELLENYFDLHSYVADPAAVCPGLLPYDEFGKAADSSDNFLVVILSDSTQWSQNFRFDVEFLRESVVKRGFCSFTVVEDADILECGSIRGLSGSPPIPHYDIWQNTAIDSPEFFEYLVQLFRAIVEPTPGARKQPPCEATKIAHHRRC